MRNILAFWVVVALSLAASALSVRAQSPTLDPSFFLTSATGRPGGYAPDIRDMVLQPDGKLVVGGDFIALNGRPVVNLARLLPDGQVDTTFADLPIDGEVASLALQADGKLLLGGYFTTVGGQSRIGIARLLPTGALDPAFISPFGGAPPPYAYSIVNKLVVQPGRGIIVAGMMVPSGSTGGGFTLTRLLGTTGALDPTFQPGFNTIFFQCHDVLVQPNGGLVFAGSPRLFNGQQCYVWGALPDGALDPAFVPLPGPNAFSRAYALARDPATGNLYAAVATASGLGLVTEPVRLLPNGARDPSFSVAGVFPPATVGGVNSLAVQPNGRLLLGGGFPTPGGFFFGSARLLPGGALDPSYDPSFGPNDYVRKVLVQPDGALLFAGVFQEVRGLPVNCLARMLDSNVLSARAPASPNQADELAVWPVPAREVLHLRLPAGRPARQAALLDALGRVALRQALPVGQSAPVLPTAGLPPGAYLLRVDFASGPPAYRRVAVE